MEKTNIKCSGYRTFANIISVYWKISWHTCFYYSCFICTIIKMLVWFNLGCGVIQPIRKLRASEFPIFATYTHQPKNWTHTQLKHQLPCCCEDFCLWSWHIILERWHKSSTQKHACRSSLLPHMADNSLVTAAQYKCLPHKTALWSWNKGWRYRLVSKFQHSKSECAEPFIPLGSAFGMRGFTQSETMFG